MKIVIYIKPMCPYCVRAKALLDKLGLSYEKIDVSRDRNLMHEMIQKSSRRTVPQIFINEKSIGGFDDLYELYVNNKLDDLLTAT